MPTPLPVHVSRSERHAIETVESFEATGPFAVEVTNHGEDAHVHLRPDRDLATVARVDGDGNYYVEAGETRRIPVEADPPADPVTGGLYVETGYGTESARVEVTVGEPDEEGVDVDESLGHPDPPDETGEGPAPVPEGTLSVAALALVALAVSGLIAVTVDSAVVVAGVVVVFLGILAAAALLLR